MRGLIWTSPKKKSNPLVRSSLPKEAKKNTAAAAAACSSLVGVNHRRTPGAARSHVRFCPVSRSFPSLGPCRPTRAAGRPLFLSSLGHLPCRRRLGDTATAPSATPSPAPLPSTSTHEVDMN